MRLDEDGFPIWEDTPLRKVARTENWAIYLLRGIRTNVIHYIQPHMSDGNYCHLINAIDEAIINIKDKQQQRKLK